MAHKETEPNQITYNRETVKKLDLQANGYQTLNMKKSTVERRL